MKNEIQTMNLNEIATALYTINKKAKEIRDKIWNEEYEFVTCPYSGEMTPVKEMIKFLENCDDQDEIDLEYLAKFEQYDYKTNHIKSDWGRAKDTLYEMKSKSLNKLYKLGLAKPVAIHRYRGVGEVILFEVDFFKFHAPRYSVEIACEEYSELDYPDLEEESFLENSSENKLDTNISESIKIIKNLIK